MMAHETGHIAGGHLARKTQIMKNAMIESVIGMVLGGAASALGHGNAGGAGVLAGADVGQRAFMQNSVTIEASADQAALRFLDRTHQSTTRPARILPDPRAGGIPDARSSKTPT